AWHLFYSCKSTLFLKNTAMKKLKSTLIVLVLVCLAGTNWLFAQSNSNEYLGLPGDNLNLYAVMDVFQNSETIEA
ncbi:MAG TPA: hypothetical protein DG754_07725, partial [Bacteroidales bacterium]|nr:hypothetical protein [Bacteroidales bacterium]